MKGIRSYKKNQKEKEADRIILDFKQKRYERDKEQGKVPAEYEVLEEDERIPEIDDFREIVKKLGITGIKDTGDDWYWFWETLDRAIMTMANRLDPLWNYGFGKYLSKEEYRRILEDHLMKVQFILSALDKGNN